MYQFQSFGEVVAALRRRALLIVCIVVVGCVVSIWVAMQQTKLYETSAVVQIEDARIPEPMSDTANGATTARGDASRHVRLIEQRLMARDNIVALMEEYRLFPQEPSTTERIFALRQAIRIDELRGNAEPWQTDVAPSGLRITVRLDDPQDAADIANDLMMSVIDEARARDEARAAEAMSFFAAEAERLSSLIEEQEAAIASFKRENASSLPDGVGALREQLATFEENLLALDREIIALQTNSGRVRREDLQRQVVQLQEQKLLIEQRISEIEADLSQAPDVERTLSALERDLTQLQERYTVVTRRQADAEMSSVLQDRDATDRFEVLETALVPDVSVSRSKTKVALAGGVLSVVLAFGLAVLLEALNPAIRTAAQMEQRLGIAPVVSIPPIRSKKDRRRGRLLRVSVILALFAIAFAALRTFGGAVIGAGMFWRQADL